MSRPNTESFGWRVSLNSRASWIRERRIARLFNTTWNSPSRCGVHRKKCWTGVYAQKHLLCGVFVFFCFPSLTYSSFFSVVYIFLFSLSKKTSCIALFFYSFLLVTGKDSRLIRIFFSLASFLSAYNYPKSYKCKTRSKLFFCTFLSLRNTCAHKHAASHRGGKS